MHYQYRGMLRPILDGEGWGKMTHEFRILRSIFLGSWHFVIARLDCNRLVPHHAVMAMRWCVDLWAYVQLAYPSAHISQRQTGLYQDNLRKTRRSPNVD